MTLKLENYRPLVTGERIKSGDLYYATKSGLRIGEDKLHTWVPVGHQQVDVVYSNKTMVTVLRQVSGGLCDRCEFNQATDDHTCPYAEEIHDDYSPVCNCCYDCTQWCADDI